MPPRKSDVSKVVTGDEATPAKEQVGINIEELNLPKSIVTRLAKGVLPPNTQIQGNAMLAMTKSATVFVNHLAAQANDHAGSNNRKTVTPQDVLNALEDLEFADFKPRLEAELAKYNEMQNDKRAAYRNKLADKAAGKNGGGDLDGDTEVEGQLDRDGQPASKKARIDPDDSLEVDRSEMPDVDHAADEDAGDDEPEDDDEEVDQEERLEVEEQLEEPEEKEAADEALDNGEDSD